MTEIHSPAIFWTAAGIVVGYLLYMMIRRRKGERPGQVDREHEL
jgi:hypothetical protein